MAINKLDFETFNISSQRGFLPQQDPLCSLNSYFQPWEEIGTNLHELIQDNKLNKLITELPLLSIDRLQTLAEKERAMILLGFISHAFLRYEEEERNTIPACLAIPWTQLAEKLGRYPILAHVNLVLNNWQKRDQAGEMVADNLKALVQITEYADESWFYVATTEVEVSGAAVPALLLGLRSSVVNKDVDKLKTDLKTLTQKVEAMHHSLSRMRKGCRPEIFYHKIRPYLTSFKDITYEGVPNPIRNYFGGSAGQSSLLQSVDAVLAIEHSEESHAGQYLKEMLNYMPKPHANFIRELQKGPNIKGICEAEGSLKEIYQDCVQSVLNLRNEHLKIVSEYIMAQAQGPAIGTGGTSPLPFLKQVRNDTGRNKRSLK